jgi:hypothetical protein
MNMKNQSEIYRKLTKSFVLMFIVCFWSCQEVIHVDLNSASPKLIIDAGISDQQGPYTVVLSQTVAFDLNNTFPSVTGALVVISDNAGNIDTLIENKPGTYQTTNIQGIPGHTYTITVKSDNTVYTAISTMPFPVPIDTVVSKNRFGTKNKELSVSFNDSKGIDNYYRIIEKITYYLPDPGRIILPTLGTVSTDKLMDGTKITVSPGFNQPELLTGDSVLVSLECIDKNVYTYFRTASQTGNQSTTVSNPVSNITNGALGYFSAYTVRYYKILVN